MKTLIIIAIVVGTLLHLDIQSGTIYAECGEQCQQQQARSYARETELAKPKLTRLLNEECAYREKYGKQGFIKGEMWCP